MPGEVGSRERALVLLLLWAALLAVIIGRAGQLQLVQGARYQGLALQNRVKRIDIPSPRGMITDRNGTIIAESRPGYDLVLVATREWQPSVRRASQLLGIDSIQLESTVRHMRNLFPKDPVKLVKDLNPVQVAIIEEHLAELPELRVESEAIRNANFGYQGSHVLGYVAEIGQREYSSLKAQGYRYGDYIGKGGLERQYEPVLRGDYGCEFIEVDARGRELGGIGQLPAAEPTPGVNVTLTIDWKLQQFAEGLFDPDLTGAAVAIEPATGRILALVSRPNFDPNIFSAGVRAEDWSRLLNDPAAPLWDRAVRSLYPPGSTFKAATALAALSESLVTESSYMRSPCRGWLKIGNRVFKCWAKGGHGSLNLHQAMVQSCDVYFYQLGMMLKVSNFSKWALRLGLGRRTGIDLPKEVPGLIPTEQWYDARLGKGRITAGLSANMAIGQGEVLVTPLQMAMLYAAIGNHGMLARPHLVLKTERFDGEVLAAERIETAKLPVSEAAFATVARALEGVVNEPGGTGGAARVEGVLVAGKTGTAQNPHGKDHSWFVGFAPSDNPAIAVAVVVENAGHGSAVAAPMVGKIIREYLGRIKSAPAAPQQLAGRP